MNDISDERLTVALREACEIVAAGRSQGLASLADVLRRQITGDHDPLNALVAGLMYRLVVESSRRTYGPFEPAIVLQHGVYPPLLDHVNPETAQIWAHAARQTPLQLAASRFADLLWECRFDGESHNWARRAIESYVAAANETCWDMIELADGVCRALEIARQLNDRMLQRMVIDVLAQVARMSLAPEDYSPRACLAVLNTLARLRDQERPSSFHDLMDEAVSKCQGSPGLLESALDIKAQSVSAKERTSLYEGKVRAFADLARRSEGLARYAHYQRAIELAEQHGLRSHAEDLRREVEEIPEQQLGLREVEATIEVPSQGINRVVDKIVGDDRLEAALARLGTYIPTGDPEKNRLYVRMLMAEHPLQFTIPRMVIGPENALIRSIRTPDEHREAALVQHELTGLMLFGILAVEVIKRLAERYGPVSTAASWFENDLIEPVVAQGIRNAIELYEQAHYDASASVLVPRLERVIRSIARATGLAITTSPYRGRLGGVKGLGTLLDSLQPVLPERSFRYLRVLLTEPTGANLRNRVAHGLVDLATAQEAALLIQAACHLRLFKVETSLPERGI